MPETVSLPAGFRPEGITSGPGLTFYVGSVADGRIATGSLRTGAVRNLLPGATGRSLRGLFWDRRTGLVWAVGSVGDVGHVWAVNGRSGAVVSDTVVPGAKFLNDLVVTRDRVWVTDSMVDRLTWIRLGPRGRPTGTPARSCACVVPGRPATGSPSTATAYGDCQTVHSCSTTVGWADCGE
ncbi:MAG TPA: hypothetical protein VFJ94_01075 [Intrasporangium sp.]|uniref:hypothetical protein n=1 Tax=Intrasporangium sp. TaxID=1925024 RepID=UPI002D7695EA|nr:hypothetical protein [Intrasporangium sp.]HET7397083.1 hypothetical protein [Intrasporangium sp.]